MSTVFTLGIHSKEFYTGLVYLSTIGVDESARNQIFVVVWLKRNFWQPKVTQILCECPKNCPYTSELTVIVNKAIFINE